MIEIDGSSGEGGGQMVRTAVSLSALTGTPVRIVNIRANRPNPGLNHQHMTAIQSVASLCGASVVGLSKGSSIVEFEPYDVKSGRYHFDVLTAGSTCLVLQTCLLPSLFSTEVTEFTITGGTDVNWAPPLDYLRFVFAPMLHRMGGEASIVLNRRGHYPKGGGEIVCRVKPVRNLQCLVLNEQGQLRTIRGISHVSNLPGNITRRMKHAALLKLVDFSDIHISEENYPKDKDPSFGTGAGIVLMANYDHTILGSSSLGERGVPSEMVAQTGVNRLLEEMESGATLDIHAADQFLPYMALASGKSLFLTRELTNHARTNIGIVEQFLDVKFRVREEGGLHEVGVEGAGHKGKRG
jgi:RNA 3'-phosphate cyclase